MPVNMEYFYALIATYKYLILFPVAVLEGPIVAVLAGVLIKFGQISLLPAYIILVLGNVIPDIAYYGMGRFGQKNFYTQKYINKFSFIRNNFKLIEKLWNEHFRKTVFLSKLAYGLSTPFLISAGLVKVPFSKFISHTIIIDLFDIALFIFLGIVFGKTYNMVSNYIDYFAIIIALLFILFIVVFRHISKQAADEIVKLKD